MSVGRDGASDAVSFLEAGIPAVEFGPIGGGHHGPEEWVSVASLERYRQALGDFVRDLPGLRSRASTPAAAACGDRGRAGVSRRAAAAPRPSGGKRSCSAALLIVALTAGGDGDRRPPPGRTLVDDFNQGARQGASIAGNAHAEAGRAADDPAPRLRPPLRRHATRGDAARSDTIMLIRLDPDKKATTVLSIPRDLKVDIPGLGLRTRSTRPTPTAARR